MQKQEPAGDTSLDVLTLDGWRLDYFTGLALGYEMLISLSDVAYKVGGDDFSPTADGQDLMPVLLRMRTVMKGADGNTDWMARAEGCEVFARGPLPEIAICRALVLSKFGEIVKLPCGALRVSVSSYKNDSDVADNCEDLFA